MPNEEKLSPKQLQEMLDTLERLLPVLRKIVAGQKDMCSSDPEPQQSYVQLAITVLEELGRPTPITVLLEQIRERKHNPNITRGAVETSLLRHLNTKGDDTPVVKLSPGTYALRYQIEPCT